MNALSSTKTRGPRFIEGVIANLPLMQGISRAVIRQLSMQSALVHAKRGETIVRRNQTVPGLFAIAYGSVKERLNRRDSEVVLALLGPGDTFAEVAALLGRPARTDVIALADSMLVIIKTGSIHKHTERDPRLAQNVADSLARRLQALLAEFEQGMLPSLQRLACYLDSIAAPGEAPGTWIARLPVSKTLVAARLDIKKETLSRLLRELTSRGLISVARREIHIHDRAALAALEP